MNTSLFRISLKGLKFYSNIGVFLQEREVGNDFEVDVTVCCKASEFREDKLESTLSYADIFEIVKVIMGEEYLLLETVAKRICDRISGRWPEVEEVVATVRKLAAPIPGIMGNCEVEYFWKKS